MRWHSGLMPSDAVGDAPAAWVRGSRMLGSSLAREEVKRGAGRLDAPERIPEEEPCRGSRSPLTARRLRNREAAFFVLVR